MDRLYTSNNLRFRKNKPLFAAIRAFGARNGWSASQVVRQACYATFTPELPKNGDTVEPNETNTLVLLERLRWVALERGSSVARLAEEACLDWLPKQIGYYDPERHLIRTPAERRALEIHAGRVELEFEGRTNVTDEEALERGALPTKPLDLPKNPFDGLRPAVVS